MPRTADALRGLAPRRLLVVRLSALGDVLHCLPALAALRSLHPHATIDWVTESLGASILEGHPDLGRVVRFPRKEIVRGLRRPSEGVAAWTRGERFVAELREHSYDLLVDLQGNLRSAFVGRTARARVRIGHHPAETKEYPWLLGAARAATRAGAVHRVEKNLHLVRALGYRGPVPPARLPDYAEEVARIAALPELAGPPPTLLQPFVSAFGRFKEWPGERYAELARRLADRGHRVLVTCAPEDDERRDEILDRAGDAASASPETPSPRELAALLRLSRGLVAADTGPLHLAAFSGVPVVGLFGPKDPKTYGPWSERAAVRRGDVPCAPCRLRRCDHAICMQSISVETVVAAVEEAFATTPTAATASTAGRHP